MVPRLRTVSSPPRSSDVTASAPSSIRAATIRIRLTRRITTAMAGQIARPPPPDKNKTEMGLTFMRRIRGPIPAPELAVPAVEHHVDVGIAAEIIGTAGADFQIGGIAIRPVDEVVAIGHPLGKGGAVTCAQDLFAPIGDQDQFARQQIDQLVLDAVPMTLAGPGPRRQSDEIDPEIADPGRVAQRLLEPFLRHFMKWRGITRSLAWLYRSDVNF